MRKLLLLLTLCIWFTLPLTCMLLIPAAHAGPLTWVNHHKRFLAMEATAITAASIHAAGLHHCRHLNGVEPCDEHYGSAWAEFGLSAGLSVIAFPAIAEGCWHNGGSKSCYLFAYAPSAIQAGWGIHEWRINEVPKPDNPETRDPKPDLSSIVIIHSH